MSFFEAAANYPLLLITLLGFFGLLFGSFFNVVIYRLPKMMESTWKYECEILLSDDDAAAEEITPPQFNLAFPNSHCPKCNAPVKAWQNIPVVSYVLLRGRCASCKAPIGLRYPTVEVITALLTVFPLLMFGFTTYALAAILFSWILLILTVIDIDHQLLPDQLTLPLIWLGLLFNSVTGSIPLQDAVWGAIGGYLSLWSVFWLFKLLTGKEGMGYGDFKLLAALGAWLGWQYLPLIILLSSVVGAVFGGLVMLLRRSDSSMPMPFGPYLAGAGWIALFWGEALIDGYLQLAGIR
ncbi:prepilin peptidase [Zhongshania aliphaticivorans]|uniref:Prepilin leader peptidase/N-methyltransferase n=1 Tax=Zhongshania aliphaticivorans TaxID=1470434 RepID=A0A127M871_9GAMM|nr:A24 family peptidase [Zhongshania aliphaticivorans]AMO69439.1 methyltransferase [Zhongshania aliphaticivorans]